MAEDTASRCPRCGSTVGQGLRFCTECGTPIGSAPDVAAAPAAPVAAPACPVCGTPLGPGLRFCVECGTPVPGAAAAGPAAPPVYTPQPPYPPARSYADAPGPVEPARRSASRGRRVLLVVVAVLLLLGGGAVGATLLLGDEDPGTAAARGPERDDDAVVPPSSSPSATSPALPEPSESASATPSPPPVRCWDGTRADRVDECSQPAGRLGLRWVFPSLARADCFNNRAAIDTDRLQLWSCTDYLRDGTAIEIHYSQWGSVRPAIEHYDTRAYDKESLPGGLIRWFIISHDGLYKAALMYRDAPWSVTVYSPTEDGRQRALETLVTLRPRGQLRGKG